MVQVLHWHLSTLCAFFVVEMFFCVGEMKRKLTGKSYQGYWTELQFYLMLLLERAINSAGECYLDVVEVTSSILVSPKRQPVWFNNPVAFFISVYAVGMCKYPIITRIQVPVHRSDTPDHRQYVPHRRSDHR